MSDPIYRYTPSEVDDDTANILRTVVYPTTHPEYLDTVVQEQVASFNTALHLTSAMNHAELASIKNKIGSTPVGKNDYKNRYTVSNKQWDVTQLLQDIRDNDFMLRLDTHTVWFSNYSKQRRVTEATMVHYKTQVMELATTIEGVQTITLSMGDTPTNSTLKRVNNVLRDFGWVLKYRPATDAFGNTESTLRLCEDWPGGWYVQYEDGMYIDMEYGSVYLPSLDNIIPVKHRPAV